ncbi:MAG: hypothetical protein IID44_07045 [Planctomycetes bacterium]|nr:hypothetical protein [Planctomycetota bacterium]
MDFLSLPMVESPTFSQRRCGECTACCVDLPISAGLISAEAKPAGTPCVQLCEQGCRDYEGRPDFCQAFRCAWHKSEHWPVAWRPHESGLLCLQEPLDEGRPAALVYEIRAGALRSPEAAEIIESLRETSSAVAIVDFRGNRQLRLGKLRIEESHIAPPKPHFESAAVVRQIDPAATVP